MDSTIDRVLTRLERLNTYLEPQNVPYRCECPIRTTRTDGSSNCSNRVRYGFFLSNGTRIFTCGLRNHTQFGYNDCMNGITAEVAVRRRAEQFQITHVDISRENGLEHPIAGMGSPSEQIRMFDQCIERLSRERSVADESRNLARVERENLYNYMLAQSRIVSSMNSRILTLNKLKREVRKLMSFRLPWCCDPAKQDTLCAICHCADMSQENSGHLNECKHQFHYNCIQTWFDRHPKKTCPICRIECDTEKYYV